MSSHRIPSGGNGEVILGFFGVMLGWVPTCKWLRDTGVGWCSAFCPKAPALRGRVVRSGIAHLGVSHVGVRIAVTHGSWEVTPWQQSATLSTQKIVLISWICGPGVNYRWVWAVEKPKDLVLLLIFYHPGGKRNVEMGIKAS